MKSFKFQEVLDFILNQPDEKELDFSHPINDDKCGCLMVQFGVEKGIKFSSVNYQGDKFLDDYQDAVAIIEDMPEYDVITIFNDGDPNNFGALKNFVKTSPKFVIKN